MRQLGGVAHEHVVTHAGLLLALEFDLQLLLELVHFALETHLVDGAEVVFDVVIVHLAVRADVDEDHCDYY